MHDAALSACHCHAVLCCALQAKGLRPQLFLSASHFESATGQPVLVSPVAPVPESDSSSTAATDDSSGSGSGAKQGSKRRPSSIVPDAARAVLEVFVLDKRELAAALTGSDSSSSSSGGGGGGSSSADPVQQKMQQLGLQMAILTTFSRLLELKMIHLEGDEGTGPLETDLQLLATADAAAEQAGSSGAWGDAGSALPTWKRHCLLYRAGQKALVRSYITAARAELQDTLAELQALMEANGYSS
jgi:hypothetical protein